MNDKQIIDLFFARDESAISETDQKYGSYCYRIALNALGLKEDAEECVNDTYLSVWNQIPPTIPNSFKVFLGRITRNISISRYRSLRAKKRFSNMKIMLSELDECIPSSLNVEQLIEAKQLSVYISEWLDALKEEECMLFVRRYWYGDDIMDLAQKCDTTPAKIGQKMFRLRKNLKVFLEKKGVAI